MWLRYLMIAVCSLYLLMTTGYGNAGESTIIVRVADYPPQYYKDTTGRWTGIDVELARALVVEAGFTPEFIEVPWGRALEEMKNGRLHLMTTLSKTPERATFMHWIGPERMSEMVLVVKQANKNLPIATLDSLIAIAEERSLKIGMQHNVYYGEVFAGRLMEDAFAIHFESVATSALNPRKTRAGRILGFFEDKITMQYQIKHNREYAGLATHHFTLNEEPVFFGVSRSVPAPTLNRLKEAFDRLERSGELDQIRAQVWW